jgi:hypothetical protein
MDSKGKTILHYAVINNNLNILETLLNYCAKYKINVDIPDGVNKITPFLLACRLNLNQASNLLLTLGRASKSQQDHTVFYDAERWKHEGQLEKLKDYLKCTKHDIVLAQINGNYKAYRDLCEISQTLDSKSLRSQEILPLLTKVLNEQDGDDFGGHSFLKPKTKAKTKLHQTIIKPIKSKNLPSFTDNYTQMKSQSQSQQSRFVRNKSPISSSAFFSSSQSPSSATSSSNYWSSSKPIVQGQSLSSYSEELSNSTCLKETVDRIMKKASRQSQSTRQRQDSGVNTLLEMTSNQQTVESFFASKSDNEVVPHEASSAVGSASFVTRSADSSLHSHSMGSSGGESLANHHHSHLVNTSPFNYGLSQMFYTAALQQTKSYRSSVKYVEPVIFEKASSVNKSTHLSLNKKNSKSTLAIIREESRLGKIKNKNPKLLPNLHKYHSKPINMLKTSNLKLLKS